MSDRRSLTPIRKQEYSRREQQWLDAALQVNALRFAAISPERQTAFVTALTDQVAVAGPIVDLLTDIHKIKREFLS